MLGVLKEMTPDKRGEFVLDDLFHLDITVPSITEFERALTKWKKHHVSEEPPEQEIEDDTAFPED